MDSYTDNQIEVANLLKGESPELVDEIMSIVGEAEKSKLRDGVGEKKEQTEAAIKLQLLYETDWRKKASLAAMLISKSLD